MQHDRVEITGAAQLDGTLIVCVADSFSPRTGDVFTVVTYESLQGAFAELELGAPTSVRFEVTYDSLALNLEAVVSEVPMDIVGRHPDTGRWLVGRSTGDEFLNELWGSWSTNVAWTHVMTGDFTGNGRTDIAGRDAVTGDWWVARSTGDGFISELWGRWSPAIEWVDVMIGDFNGDGRADVVGRNAANGRWLVARSTGSEFTNEVWGQWTTAIDWQFVTAGDFTGNGRTDIVARNPENGRWSTTRHAPSTSHRHRTASSRRTISRGAGASRRGGDPFANPQP